MTIYSRRLDIQEYNHFVRPPESSVDAVEGDIAYLLKYDNLQIIFLCQTQNGYNNIVATRLTAEPDIRTVKLMYWFMLILYRSHNIRYVRVHSIEPNKYNFLRKFPTALKKNNHTFYCDLLAAEYLLEEEINKGA